MRLQLPALLVALAGAAGCGNRGGDAAPAGAVSAATPAGVDARVDALARAALPCKAYDTSIDSSCPAMKAWSDAKGDFDEGKADASLVAMLADGDEKMRYLGAYKLNQYGKAFKADKALAAAVVVAAEKETSKLAGYALGATVGRVLVRETGTFDRVTAMVTKHDVPDVRRGIVSSLLPSNQDDEPVFGLVRDTVKDPDKAVAEAALQSFWTGGTRRGDATCRVFADNIESPNDAIAGEASDYLAWFGQCSASFDALLDALERRVKAGSVSSPCT